MMKVNCDDVLTEHDRNLVWNTFYDSSHGYNNKTVLFFVVYHGNEFSVLLLHFSCQTTN